MNETALHMALLETASAEGIRARARHLKEHGAHELGWSYKNILDAEKALNRQLDKRGYFHLYLFLPGFEDGKVTHRMRITALVTSARQVPFKDPVDGRNYLVHSHMTVDSVEGLREQYMLAELKSTDNRKPDIRHLQLGFLFIVDPEAEVGPG
jgi:hypothetical protein